MSYGPVESTKNAILTFLAQTADTEFPFAQFIVELISTTTTRHAGVTSNGNRAGATVNVEGEFVEELSHRRVLCFEFIFHVINVAGFSVFVN